MADTTSNTIVADDVSKASDTVVGIPLALTVAEEVLPAPVTPPKEEGQANMVAPEPPAAPEMLPAPALVADGVSKAIEQAAPAPAKAETPPAAQGTVVGNKAASPSYVCKNKKHGSGTAYFVVEGKAFCNLCIRDFFLRHLLRPMKKNETP